jgi:hypothetical protein
MLRHGPLALVLAAACHTAPETSPQKPLVPAPITRVEAQAVLDAQVACWNRGDLKGFVATYWDGPELTFLGSSGLTRGREDLLFHYERAYPDAEARGVLSFAILDVQPLGSEHALLLGSYHLARKEPGDGFFSLVLARRNGAIVILHDHTSEQRRVR